MSFFDSLTQGNIVPQWDSLRCGGFGCPQFIFMYILPYYLISLFHSIGFSFINSAKLLLGLSFIASAVTMYAFTKEEFGKKAGLIGGIYYLFAPYHLVDLHFRTDVGEALSFAILPFLFLATNKIITSGSFNWISFQAIALMLLLLSHQAIFSMAFLFLFCYAIFKWKNERKKSTLSIRNLIFSLMLGLLLSAFYWIPILTEAKYVFWGIHGSVLFIEPINLFFFSPWRFGFLFQGPEGQLSFIIGYFHLLIIISAIILLTRKTKSHKSRKYISFFLISFFIAFFMMLSLSKGLWNIVPFLNKSQFSYRLLLPIAFFTSSIAAIILKKLPNKWIVIICLAIIFSTILNWGHRRVMPEINDNYLRKELVQTAPTFEVTIPKWVNLKHIGQYKRSTSIETISGEADILALQKKITKHEYIIRAKTNITVRENTFYYPGWTLRINNNLHPIDYLNKQFPGVITFQLDKGLYKIDLTFSNTPIRTISSFMSVISALALFLPLIFPRIFGWQRPKDAHREVN